MKESVVKSAGWLINELLPRRCVACGSASGDRNLCHACLAELPRIVHGCRLCGTSLSQITDGVCGSCLGSSPPWQHGTAALEYEFPVNQLVCRFKFQRNLACGQVLMQELLDGLLRTAAPLPDIIIPVPLHPIRHFMRSFNQAEVLSRGVARSLKIPLSSRTLRRIRRTSAQSGLNAGERRKNIKGAFASEPVGSRHVALVDDVLTTGTTLVECCRTLRRAGASEISVWVATRANISGGVDR